jgi:hypothetical protein
MTIDADAQDASPVTLAAARAEFDADVTYLDTATFGLPPRRSWAALQQASSTTVRTPCTRNGPPSYCRRHINFDLAAAQARPTARWQAKPHCLHAESV